MEDYRKFLESNKTILRSQQSFRGELHNVFTEKIKKIAVSANNDRSKWASDEITTCPYGYEFYTESVEYKKIKHKNGHKSDWPQIPNQTYRILIVGGSGSEKTNALLNLKHHQSEIDKIFLYAKDP